MSGLQRAFEIKVDADGFYVARPGERLTTSCSSEQDVDAQLVELKDALDAVATRMKKLIREQDLSDPFALPAS